MRAPRSTQPPLELVLSFRSLSHLADHVLLSDLAALVARDRTNTAAMLAHLAEVEARKLYVPAGYSSLRAYCVTVLRMSEDEAGRRIHVANKARLYPALLDAIASGGLHLTGASLLASHLTLENVDELLAAALNRTKSEIEYLIAVRFPRPDVPTTLRPLAGVPDLTRPPAGNGAHVPEHAGSLDFPSAPLAEAVLRHVPEHVASTDARHVPEHVPAPAAKTRWAPLSADSYELRTTLDHEANDLLQRSQDLEGLPSGPAGVAEALKRALRARVAQLEKRKFGATDKPRPDRNRRSKNPRYIPPTVKRAVRKRDGGQCTYVSTNGHRCESRRVEFDHVIEVARGGKSTVSNVRLLCRAHNQNAAECTYGPGFMSTKREAARCAAEEAKAAAAAKDAMNILSAILAGTAPNSALPGRTGP